MTIKVGINGFGRIGRMVFRAVYNEFDNIEIVGINDLLDADYLAYMLKYDSVHGRFGGTVEAGDGCMIVDGKTIRLTAERDPADLKWGDVGAEIVIDSTGFFLTEEGCQKHIDAGAKKVVQSAPSKDGTPMFVYGVNHTEYAGQAIVSAASCTTNCLAPVAKVLNDKWGIKRGLMTTVHAATATQKTVDGPSQKDWRGGRGILENIIPSSTGAAKAIGLVIPELDGKLIGSAQRVPVPSGSITILDATLKDETDSVSVEGINEAMKKASDESFGYSDEELVSSDTIGMSYGSLFDSTQTLAQRCGTKIYEVRVVAWYDNEMSYVSQLIRTLDHMGNLMK